MDWQRSSSIFSHILKSISKQQLVCKFGIMENESCYFTVFTKVSTHLVIPHEIFRRVVFLTEFLSAGSLLLTWFNLIPASISNHTHYNVWDDITYPFLNFNGATVEVYEWISNFITLHWACDYLSMLGLKLMHISKRGHWNQMGAAATYGSWDISTDRFLLFSPLQ